jgi:hypothetical protein
MKGIQNLSKFRYILDNFRRTEKVVSFLVGAKLHWGLGHQCTNHVSVKSRACTNLVTFTYTRIEMIRSDN